MRSARTPPGDGGRRGRPRLCDARRRVRSSGRARRRARDDSSYSKEHDSDSGRGKGSDSDNDSDNDNDYGNKRDGGGEHDGPRGGMHTGGGALAAVRKRRVGRGGRQPVRPRELPGQGAGRRRRGKG
ncbi:hypothetical protein GCM10017687_06710 [Streptomyces echinatus]